MNESICKRVEKWWKPLWFSFTGWMPILRRTHRAQMESLSQLSVRKMKWERERANKEIADAKKVLDAIYEKACRTNWRFGECGTYRLDLSFDPRMMGGYTFRSEELRYLAQHFGHMVEREIATCKFIEKAQETERERLRNHGYFEQP